MGSPFEFSVEGESSAAPVCKFSLVAQVTAPIKPAGRCEEALPASSSAGVRVAVTLTHL